MMATDWIQIFRQIVLEPTFGFPLILSCGAILAWVLWSPPAGERRLPPLRRNWFEPESDLASQMYYALMDGQYSRAISATAARLDEAVRTRRGRSVYDLPWSRSAAVRANLPEAPALRRVLRQIIRAHGESVEREGRFFIRWRFWLSHEADRARYLARVDATIDSAARWIRQLEGT
jgi:hypothetical protein